MGEAAELLADAAIEVRPRHLREPPRVVTEAHLDLVTWSELADVLPVEGDVDRVASGLVTHLEDVVGGDDQGPRGERVRGNEADHISLHPPREDRPLVGEVVAGGSGRR